MATFTTIEGDSLRSVSETMELFQQDMDPVSVWVAPRRVGRTSTLLKKMLKFMQDNPASYSLFHVGLPYPSNVDVVMRLCNAICSMSYEPTEMRHNRMKSQVYLRNGSVAEFVLPNNIWQLNGSNPRSRYFDNIENLQAELFHQMIARNFTEAPSSFAGCIQPSWFVEWKIQRGVATEEEKQGLSATTATVSLRKDGHVKR